MSDLISRSEVIDILYNVFDEYRIATDKTSTLGGFGSEVFKRVMEMPTVYDIDKVVEELEENASRYTKKYNTPYGNNGYKDTKAISVNKAIEIVKHGCVSDDVCEWESDYGFISDKYKRETGCGYTFYDLHHAVPFKYCPYCGKKIKVVE